MPYDLVIRNGMVVDGSGSPSKRADVGIQNGRITKVGLIRDSAHKVVEAEGHVVSPGFIDGHTHMDAQVMWDELGSCSCYHGVTTVVMGNCGFTIAPVRPGGREFVVRNIQRAEDISADALEAGIDWTWESFSEYLDVVEKRPKSINHAAYVGHSALRTWAMGERAFTDTASEDDLKLMEYGLTDAMQAGAMGFTTSRGPHLTPEGGPVASRLATWDEVRRLVGRMGDLGVGVFELALENPAGNDAEFSRLADLSASTGVPITFGAFTQNLIEGVHRINERGGIAFGQTHSRGVNSIMSFRTQLPFDSLPVWKGIRTRPLEEQRRLLTDPDIRRQLIHEAHEGPYPDAIGGEARRPNYKAMEIYARPFPPYHTVADEAARRQVDPVEVIIDLGLESGFDQLFAQALTSATHDDLRITMKDPRTAMTFSDSGAHVSQMSDASIQTFLLGHWVRNLQEFTLEEAVRLITLNPATAWGFSDRGMVREGFVADLNVFDPNTVGPEMPFVLSDLPGSGRRLVQKASGFLATIVAGEVILERGEPTGARPGRLVRGPLASN
jgi:N-acyl-D-amino-acid deacylase